MLKDLIKETLEKQAKFASTTLNSDEFEIASWLAVVNQNMTHSDAQLPVNNVKPEDLLQTIKDYRNNLRNAADESLQALYNTFIKIYKENYAFDQTTSIGRLENIIETYLEELNFEWNKKYINDEPVYHFGNYNLWFKLNDRITDFIPSDCIQMFMKNDKINHILDKMSEEDIRDEIRLRIIETVDEELEATYAAKIANTVVFDIQSSQFIGDVVFDIQSGQFIGDREQIKKLTDLADGYEWFNKFIYKYKNGHENGIDDRDYDEAYLNVETNQVVVRIGNYVKFIDNDNLKQRAIDQMYGKTLSTVVENHYDFLTSEDYYTTYGVDYMSYEEFVSKSLNPDNWVKARKCTENYYVEI